MSGWLAGGGMEAKCSRARELGGLEQATMGWQRTTAQQILARSWLMVCELVLIRERDWEWCFCESWLVWMYESHCGMCARVNMWRVRVWMWLFWRTLGSGQVGLGSNSSNSNFDRALNFLTWARQSSKNFGRISWAKIPVGSNYHPWFTQWQVR